MPDSVEWTTNGGIPLPSFAGPGDVLPGLEDRLGLPGEFPFARGVRRDMYRARPWSIRQLAGFGTARSTNERYRLLLSQGSTALNGVFDYPSLRAFDSDHPQARPDVGRGGVAVDVREDFDDLFRDIPIGDLSVSLVSSQPIGAVPHLAMYLRSAEQRGIERQRLAGTSQNDFLMETAITISPAALAPADSFRLECDLAAFAAAELPRWNPVSVSGYNYREAGADAPLEAALVLAHGQAVASELIGRGVAPEVFLPRLSFFLDAHNDFFEEVAKFRAVRRMWAHWVRDGLGVADPACQRFRFHVQTSGVTNTARFPHVNIARSALQALAAVMGGTQSLHINGFDEALSIPSEHAALTALRTQYVLLHETGVGKTADPLGGSYLVEYLTDALEQKVEALLREIDLRGGVVAATADGWVHAALAERAFADQKAVDAGEQVVVGVNAFTEGPDEVAPRFELPAGTLEEQTSRLSHRRAQRDAPRWQAALDGLAGACRSTDNVMPSVLAAVDAGATLGEIGSTFREVFGTWEFPLW